MKLYPVIDNNYANTVFGIANSIYGPRPVVSSNRIDLDSEPDITLYNVGTLMSKAADYATLATVQMYDSTASPAENFVGVFFDEAFSESAFLTTISGSTITNGFFEIATQMNVGTLFVYESLVGVNGGTTDIDALITAGIASVQVVVEGSVPIKLVQFNRMVVGA